MGITHETRPATERDRWLYPTATRVVTPLMPTPWMLDPAEPDAPAWKRRSHDDRIASFWRQPIAEPAR